MSKYVTVVGNPDLEKERRNLLAWYKRNQELFDSLCAKHNTHWVNSLPEEDRALYLEQVAQLDAAWEDFLARKQDFYDNDPAVQPLLDELDYDGEASFWNNHAERRFR